MIILILILIFIISNYYFSKKEYLLTTKKVITPKQNDDMNDIILTKMCKDKGYGYDKNFQSCKHIKKSTCVKEHPGYIADKNDIKLLNEYRDSPCTQRFESLVPIRSDVGEWLEATEKDKEYYFKKLNEYNQQRKITEKHKTKENETKLFKLNAQLMRAERNKDSKCQLSDQSFKHWCIRNKLKYVPDKAGVGKCIVTEGYCRSKIMNYDTKSKDCKKKDKIAEYLFGGTITRSFQSGSDSKNVNCENAPCFKDEYCAGRGICRPISNPGKACWKDENLSCWCDSQCLVPFTWEIAESIAYAVGSALVALLSVAIVVLAVATWWGPGILLGILAAGTAMASGYMATRSAQVATGASRCSAGKDGINVPGGINGRNHYMKLGNPGCHMTFPCPDNHYCPIGNGPCKDAKKPGESCMALNNQWCKDGSQCVTGTRASKCSAGKDGINPPGPIYKTIKIKKKSKSIHPILKKKLDMIKEMDSFTRDKKFISHKGMKNPPNQIDFEEKRIIIGNNGSKHYMKLGVTGCGPETPCPPGYYCPVGNGYCKKAKDPGSYCLAGINEWCKGDSKCFISNSRCSAGKDGINPPGPLYYKDEKGNNVIERGMIYHNGSDHYMAINSESITGIHGCDPVANYYKYPKGYFCKSAWNNLNKQTNVGGSCLAGTNRQCKGRGRCILPARGKAICAAGSDGKNPVGNYYTWDDATPPKTEPEHIWNGKKIQKITYDPKYQKPNKLINKQETSENHIPWNTRGCSIVATCPTHLKQDNNKITHTYCPVGNGKCKLPKEAGGSCIYAPGVFIGHNWCKEEHCKGRICSTKLDDNWYVPINGTCADVSGPLRTDPCEPDTYCKHSIFYKGTITDGTCTFGNG